MHEIKWSKNERQVARRAFNAAYQRECRAIAAAAHEMMASCKEPQDLWKVEEYLGKARKQIGFKYDFRYSMLIIVFGQLMRQKWLMEEDLNGLNEDKTIAIRSIAGRL